MPKAAISMFNFRRFKAVCLRLTSVCSTISFSTSGALLPCWAIWKNFNCFHLELSFFNPHYGVGGWGGVQKKSFDPFQIKLTNVLYGYLA